ncbi:MAG TPA: ROK family transcriptional regulator [Polyangiaceae bacterium]|nr:ROK family transcriptional regulator [Polyangiaceae bacterium]
MSEFPQDRKVDSRAMREVNKSIILDLIRSRDRVSRTELARTSSLTKPTVSTIVEELIAEGIVHEVGFSKSEPTGGRRARLIEFNPSSAAYVGIRFGVGSLTLALADGLGRVLGREETEQIHGDPRAALERAALLLARLLALHDIPRARVQAVGVAVGGLVETDTGRVVLSPNLGWEDVPLRQMVAERFGVPAVVANVTDAAAFAEARLGVARGVRDFVWIYVGTGIGSGIFAGGALFRGRSGFAGEIGFCRVAADGPILEQVASGRAIVERMRARDPRLPAGTGSAEVLRLAEEGNELARAVTSEAGAALGLQVAHLVNIMNPELVVLGGGVVEASSAFVDAVRAAVEEQVLGPERVPVITTALAGESVTTGAVMLAMDHAVQSVRIVSTGSNARDSTPPR